MNKKYCIQFLLIFSFLEQVSAQDKWIVVTTINYPTPALEKLAKLPDWQLVVVADKKTPKDWYLENCIFLTVEMQEELDFAIMHYLPWNHYSRKNIGYLYAIQSGATVIYETDDDNFSDDIKFLPEYYQCAQIKSSSNIINPYGYFGNLSIWPRGYPLRQISTMENSLSVACKSEAFQKVWIPIQQGLVNNDPDVDAMFRLTHKHSITFDDNPPIHLAHGTFAPFNTQNTLFYYKAFWGLLIPITVSFRVSDIWRSYWVQRLLWSIKGHLCFVAPNANQHRNEHDLLKDFIDEIDLYTKTDDYIQYLSSWHSHEYVLKNRIIELMKDLVKNEFFKPLEIDFVIAWLEDLEACGYKMPDIPLN